MLKQAQNDRFKPNYRFYVIACRKIEQKMTLDFVPGIILDHFSYPESIFRYRKLKILYKNGFCLLTPELDFLIEKLISR